jgi:hypothetical protein
VVPELPKINRNQMVPALYWDGIRASHEGLSDMPLGLCLNIVGCWMLTCRCLSWTPMKTFRIFPTLAFICTLYFLILLVMSTIYTFHLFVPGGAVWAKSCFFMPCSPQSLWERDQAFSALAGVIMVGYEFGPAAWVRVKQFLPDLIRKAQVFVGAY